MIQLKENGILLWQHEQRDKGCLMEDEPPLQEFILSEDNEYEIIVDGKVEAILKNSILHVGIFRCEVRYYRLPSNKAYS